MLRLLGLGRYIGQLHGSDPLVRLTSKLGGKKRLVADGAAHAHIYFRDRGLEFKFTLKMWFGQLSGGTLRDFILTDVVAFPRGGFGFRPFEGSLPMGIKPTMTRDDVLQ